MKNLSSNQFVYHGSHEQFDAVVPKRQKRERQNTNGSSTVTFDDVAFHATPYRWIAVTYTAKIYPVTIRGIPTYVNHGVDLYTHKAELEIYGLGSLEESLQLLYGDGGWLYTYNSSNFYHAEGLGTLEMVTKEALSPVKVDRIDDPVRELKTLGVSFKFTDISLKENEFYLDM